MAAKKEAHTKTKRLVLLDTHAILHRAYHAIPDLTTAKGEPTGALYGLATMLIKIVQELKPDYIVAARDLPGKTKRHDAYAEYKATRMKTEDALVAQLGKAPMVLEAFGVPVYSAEGYEADDVVGTIVAHVGPKKDLDTVIVTGDVDLLQLVSKKKGVEAYRMLMGITNTKFYDEAAIVERYGFTPEHIADMKGIMGDQSDNIKGVPGVGEKGALQLIKTFGGLDDIYAAIKKEGVEKVAKKAGLQTRYVQLVADNEESARFSKQLATIHCEAPIEFTMPERQWQLSDHVETIEKLCDELEFRTLKRRIQSLVGVEEERGTDGVAASNAAHPEIAPDAMKETSVALWLLHSDTSNPSLDDILRMGHTEDFTIARETIFKELKETGRLGEMFERIEKPLIPVVERMNAAGVHLDVAHLQTHARCVHSLDDRYERF